MLPINIYKTIYKDTINIGKMKDLYPENTAKTKTLKLYKPCPMARG